MIAKTLKKLGMYTYVKRKKDVINWYLRERFTFNEEMLNLYKNFVKEGDFCFDLGASHGNRTNIFLKLGARVLSVEPQEYSFNQLKRRYGKKNTILIKAGVSDKSGQQEINLCSSPELSTFEDSNIEMLNNDNRMRNLEWIGTETIEMVSMNDLIKKYGIPNFVKLDIEGYEVKAFSTLKYAIPALSFEYYTKHKDITLRCIDYISKLGEYEFNYSIKESMTFALDEWCNSEKIRKEINKIDVKTDFGDIYCRLK